MQILLIMQLEDVTQGLLFNFTEGKIMYFPSSVDTYLIQCPDQLHEVKSPFSMFH